MSTHTATAALRPAYTFDARTVGYADNDGRIVAQRIRPTFWSRIGTLQGVGTSRVLGVFDTLAEAQAAAAADLAAWEREPHTVEAVR
jgi:hypothetical protein